MNGSYAVFVETIASNLSSEARELETVQVLLDVSPKPLEVLLGLSHKIPGKW